MNERAVVDTFLSHCLSERKHAARTLRAYESDLEHFTTSIAPLVMTSVTKADLENYVTKLTEDLYQGTSIRRKIAALRMFFRFLEERGVIAESPARQLKPRQPVESRAPVVLSPRELSLLLAAPKQQIERLGHYKDQTLGARNRYFCAVRDDVILELLFSTGIRIGELVALDASDVDLVTRELRVRGRNPRSSRTVLLAADAIVHALAEYLQLRRLVSLDPDALFVGRTGGRLTIYSIGNIFKKHLHSTAIRRHLTPHALRHTVASMLMDSGADIHDVKEMLGHLSILSTQVYAKEHRTRRQTHQPTTRRRPRGTA